MISLLGSPSSAELEEEEAERGVPALSTKKKMTRDGEREEDGGDGGVREHVNPPSACQCSSIRCS